MNLIVCRVAFLVLLSVFGILEVSGKNNKIKIIVPHKINYVHHHHHPRSRINDVKSKEKFHLGPNMWFNNNYDEDESEEREENHYGRYSEELRPEYHDEALDETRGGVAYYAIPTSRHPGPATASIFMKPVFLHNDDTLHRFRHPPTYAVVRYGDYFPRERHPEDMHSGPDFDYK